MRSGRITLNGDSYDPYKSSNTGEMMPRLLCICLLMMSFDATADIVGESHVPQPFLPTPPAKYRCASDLDIYQLKKDYPKLQSQEASGAAISNFHDEAIPFNLDLTAASIPQVLAVQCYVTQEGPPNWILITGEGQKPSAVWYFLDQQPLKDSQFWTDKVTHLPVAKPGSFFVNMQNHGDPVEIGKAVWFYIMVPNPVRPH